MAKGPGKGVSNNPAGKPKGAVNRTTKEARELFVNIINGQTDFIEEALELVLKDSPSKYLDIMAKLYQYVMPRQLDVTSDEKPISDVKVTYVNKIDGDSSEQSIA